MNCRRVVNLMSAYVDGELTGMEMLKIRRHLSECTDCAAEYEEILATKLAVSRLRTFAPRPEFTAQILRKLDEVNVPRYKRFLNLIHQFVAQRRFSPVATALAASGLALVMLSAGGIETVRPNMESSEVAASAPFRTGVRSVSFMPEIPGSPIYMSDKPLEVATYTSDLSGGTLHFAGLTQR